MVTYEAPVPIGFSVKTISLLRLRQKMAENGDGHPVVTSYNEDCIVAQSSSTKTALWPKVPGTASDYRVKQRSWAT